MTEFDESKHPRDKDGKFTNKKKESANFTNEQKKRLLKTLKFFTQKRKNAETDKSQIIATMPKKAFGFGNKELLTRPDHVQHAKDLGYKTSKDYEQGAISFWKQAIGEIYYGRARKRFYKYGKLVLNGKQKNVMLVISSNGTIHTFYEVSEKKFKKISIQERLEKWKK